MIYNTIHVGTGTPYDVVIGTNILAGAGGMIAENVRGKRAVIVADSNVAPLYAHRLKSSLADAGIEAAEFVFPAGEESKTLETFGRLVEYLAKERLTRTDFLCALGGGVTGDLVGYAAASYLRGIDFVQIPTSLLAAVDSSVGGKCGVDLEAGKNLCGAFYQPQLVLFDADVLQTLPACEFACGMAEVIKYGVIRDAGFFDELEGVRGAISGQALLQAVSRCVEIKADVVSRDEREGGLRRILNFGHTAAHAIEKLSGYSAHHGEAVAVGMVLAARYAERGGVTAGAADRIAALVHDFGLPASVSECAAMHSLDAAVFAPGAMAEVAASDKKRAGDSVTLILPKKIGEVIEQKLPVPRLTEFFE